MLRIAHSADYHFEADKIDKCQQSADFIVGKLQELKPDLHIIAGDYWNRRQTLTKLSAVIPALKTMRQLAEISPVVMVYGNEAHDAAGSYEIFRNLDTTYPIYVSERAETILFMQDVDRSYFVPHELNKESRSAQAVLHLFPYPTKQWFLAGKENLSIDESNLLIQEGLRQIFTGFGAISMEAHCPVIFVGHCNVSGALLSSGQTLLGQDIMISKHDLELARADYYALGHIHKAQEVGPRMHYSGSVYHCNFGEVETKSFNVVEFDPDLMKKRMDGNIEMPTPIRLIQIPSRPLSLHGLMWMEDLPGGPMFWDPEDRADWMGADLRVRVSATKEQHLHISDQEIQARFPGAFSYQIERITIPTERIRSTGVTTAKNFADKVAEWGKVTDQKISKDVLALASDVERSVTL